MSGWIKWEKSLDSDPRVLRMARKLDRRLALFDLDVTADTDISNAAALPAVTLVCGALVRMWTYADTHIGSDDILEVGPEELDQIVGLPGFAEICPADWIEIVDDETVKLPGYQEHNGTEAKRRAQTQKRVKRHRNAQALQSGNGEALPDQDQDQDQDQKKPTTAAAQPTGDDELFAHFKQTFPKRAGSQPWPKARKAINARLREGHTWDEILSGAERYAAFCKATGKLGTETVLQAATFCGPDKRFLEPFDLPAGGAGRSLGMAPTAPAAAFDETEEQAQEREQVMRRWGS